MTVREIAKRLGKSRMTILRLIQAGCPVRELGGVGRGHGHDLDLEAVQRWIADQAAPGLTQRAQRIQLEELAESLMRVYRNDQAAAVVGIRDHQAAALLVLVYERLVKDLTRRPVDRASLPAQMKHLCSICVE